MIARFAANGIDTGAPDVWRAAASHREFLRTYDRIDIALDAFPYSGATTTAEALWQGVPVLTFNGDRWAARTSRSILLAAGLDDWVAPDQPAFEALAIRLGRTPEGLTAIRAEFARESGLPARPAIRLDCAGALEAIYREEVAAKFDRVDPEPHWRATRPLKRGVANAITPHSAIDRGKLAVYIPRPWRTPHTGRCRLCIFIGGWRRGAIPGPTGDQGAWLVSPVLIFPPTSVF